MPTPTAQQKAAAAFIQDLYRRFNAGEQLTSRDAQIAKTHNLQALADQILKVSANLMNPAQLAQTLEAAYRYTLPTEPTKPPVQPPTKPPSTVLPPADKVPPAVGAPPVESPTLPPALSTPEPAPLGPGIIPGVGVPGEGLLVGGGQEQARLALEAAELAQQGELARLAMGQQLLAHLSDIQRDPFSIVPALQAYGAAGGGTLAPAADLYASGGRGRPSPYGGLYDLLLAELGRVGTAGGGGGGAVAAAPGGGVTATQRAITQAPVQPTMGVIDGVLGPLTPDRVKGLQAPASSVARPPIGGPTAPVMLRGGVPVPTMLRRLGASFPGLASYAGVR